VQVLKFGGTSVGSATRFREVAQLVSSKIKAGEKLVVVLSAMAGITNTLIAAAHEAEERKLDGGNTQFQTVRKGHEVLIRELFTDRVIANDVSDELEPLMSRTYVLLQGVSYLGELSNRSLDAISGFGELLSSKVFARYMETIGQPCVWMDARDFVVTDETFGRATPLWEDIEKLAKERLAPVLESHKCVITQGFIGATRTGVSTTLGRGGSDYSASIIGVALGASEIQIWTDVDGMMTADPRVVPEASVLSDVSFQEASELAYFGAKVLHPLTIKPAIEKNIPVRILNTMKPQSTGTLITDKPSSGNNSVVCSIASKKSLTAIFISSPKMLMAHGFLAKVFEVFGRHETPIDLVATSEVSVSLTTDRADALDAISKDLSDFGDVRIMNDVAIITVVGSQFREQRGIAGQVFSALKDINIIMISGGASDINLSCVVHAEDADRAVQQLHREFFPTAVAPSLAGSITRS
jgi:aspartate kinase